MVNLIEQGIGGGEVGVLFHGVVNFSSLQGGQAWLPRETLYFHVAETVVGETRLIHLGPHALECVDIGHLGGAQVVQIECAVGPEPFGMTKRNLSSFRSGDGQPAPAHHVLAHVEDVCAGARLSDGNRLEGFRDADGFNRLSSEDAGRALHHLRVLPAAIVEAWVAPALHLLARIVDFAVIFAIGADRSLGGQLPTLVAHHALDLSVAIFDFELEQHFGVAKGAHKCGNIVPRREIAPIAQDDAGRIGARLQTLGDIVGQVEGSLVILAQGGNQHIVAHFGAVQVRLGEAQA